MEEDDNHIDNVEEHNEENETSIMVENIDVCVGPVCND
jgi:hypothetical protein